MSRRSTPARLDTARREATRARLISDGEPPDRAEAWLARWEAEAAGQGLVHGAYWAAGWRWIAERRG